MCLCLLVMYNIVYKGPVKILHCAVGGFTEFITRSQPFLWAQEQVTFLLLFYFLLKIQEEISVAAALKPVLVRAHISSPRKSHLAELIL